MTEIAEASSNVERGSYCGHPSAREIRLYMPYADANTIRLRAAQAPGAPPVHVSWLYEIPGGWAWTVCRDCRSRERLTA
jgi:hypothetical protein